MEKITNLIQFPWTIICKKKITVISTERVIMSCFFTQKLETRY